VAIDSIDDMAELFDGIPLDHVSTSMTINSTAIILLAMYVALAERHHVDRGRLSGTIQNDILKEYLARGTFIYPPRASLRLVTDIFAFCERDLPRWNAISVSGYHIREAGATAVQEVAFTLANGIAYIEAGVARGLSAESLGERMSFFFAAHNDFLEEIAKFRAARRMWARVMAGRFGVTNPRAQQLRFHAQTAGSTLTAQQPDNNLVRVTVQALAAVLGGAQSLHCISTKRLALPTEESATPALRTQQIIAYESGVANTVDPVGGSHEIERRTSEIERRHGAEPYRSGGGTSPRLSRVIQREIQESAFRAQQATESGDSPVVGVTKFQTDEGASIPTFRVDPDIERAQRDRVAAVRATRDARRWRAAIDAVRDAAGGDANLVPLVIAAVQAKATVGEISDVMRGVFGEASLV
jgi:methylmalonyl-CoA mutase N-terminal domain/subunit